MTIWPVRVFAGEEAFHDPKMGAMGKRQRAAINLRVRELAITHFRGTPMRLPIVEIKRSEGEAALARYTPTRQESALLQEMEAAVAGVSPSEPLETCHRAVSAVGAKHGLRKGMSVALWTRGSLRMFEAGASESPAVDVGYRLEKLVDFAFSHAAPTVLATGTLSPFLATVGTGPPALKRFEQSLSSLALAEARRAAAKLGFDTLAYALALVGTPKAPSTTRTLYVEAAERSSMTGHLFARDFRPGAPLGPFEFTGPYERVGEAGNMLING